MEAYGELIDDAGRQYIYIGPRVLNPDYPDAGNWEVKNLNSEPK